jgi:hypothetical protein
MHHPQPALAPVPAAFFLSYFVEVGGFRNHKTVHTISRLGFQRRAAAYFVTVSVSGTVTLDVPAVIVTFTV